MTKIRLDVLLVEKGLSESRNIAQRLIMAGEVKVNRETVHRPATIVDDQAVIEISHGPQYVSRGGEKLIAAVESFYSNQIPGWVCADVGSSTGGFTDCLLQSGASKVFAVDVGYGLLHWKLRNDPRVVIYEKTNARYVERFPEPIRLVTIDASFISLKILLPVIKKWGEGTIDLIALIKPQFEAGRKETARGEGVIRDPEIHRKVLNEILNFSESQGFQVVGLIKSPIHGPKGNIEFLTNLKYPSQDDRGRIDLESAIDMLL